MLYTQYCEPHATGDKRPASDKRQATRDSSSTTARAADDKPYTCRMLCSSICRRRKLGATEHLCTQEEWQLSAERGGQGCQAHRAHASAGRQGGACVPCLSLVGWLADEVRSGRCRRRAELTVLHQEHERRESGRASSHAGMGARGTNRMVWERAIS